MNYFRCIGGNGGGGAPLEFTKTSIIDPTQSPNIAFNSDYTNYDLMLFVFNDPLDNKQIEFLLTADMITEIIAIQGVYPLMFARMLWEGGQQNRHARFVISSNTLFQRITGQLEIVNVYAVTCNKNIVKTDIYKRGDTTQTAVSIESDNIFDNDIIIMSFSENGFATVNNQYVNLMNITELSEVIGYSCAPYNSNIRQILIDNSSLSSWYYFYVQGIKFT